MLRTLIWYHKAKLRHTLWNLSKVTEQHSLSHVNRHGKTISTRIPIFNYKIQGPDSNFLFDIGAFRIWSHESFKDAVFHYFFLKDAVICLFVAVSLASTQLHSIQSQVTQYLFTPTPPVSISLGPYPIKKEVRDYIQKMSDLRDRILNFSLTFYVIEIVGAID